MTKNASDVKVAAADTQRTLAGACAAGVGAANEDTHSHSQLRW